MGVGGPPSRPMGPRGAVTQPPRPLMDFGDQTVFSSPDQMQVCIILTTCLYFTCKKAVADTATYTWP